MGEPDEHTAVQGHLLGRLRPFVAQLLEEPRTHVVAPPLAHRGAELEGQDALEFGDVFLDELVLQVDGVGGDDDATAVEHRPKSGWQQIANALARARARLDEQMLALVERLNDGRDHIHLLCPRLETCEGAGEVPLGAKHAQNFLAGDLVGLFFGGQGLGFDGRGFEQLFLVAARFGGGFFAAAIRFAHGRFERLLKKTRLAPAHPQARFGNFAQDGHIEFGRLFVEGEEEFGREQAIIEGAMALAVFGQGQIEVVGQIFQPIPPCVGEQNRGEGDGVNGAVVERHLFLLQKAHIKTDVVPDDDMVGQQAAHLGAELEQAGGIGHHGIGNAGNVGDFGGDGGVRPNEGAVFLHHFAILQQQNANFNDGGSAGV